MTPMATPKIAALDRTPIATSGIVIDPKQSTERSEAMPEPHGAAAINGILFVIFWFQRRATADAINGQQQAVVG